MFKKLICMLMTMVMLVAMVVPAAAAEETSSRPTVEEILNGYHEKAFAQQTCGATESPAAYSRSGGSQKTLEQETVEELTAAGYEAYNVTAENYDTLEESLKSDFASMGLSRDGSYIIVIGGDEPEETASSRAIIGGGPAYDHIGDGSGGVFTHTYEGTTYSMRYVTITGADNIDYVSAGVYLLGNIFNDYTFPEEIMMSSFSALIDSCDIPITTLASLLFGFEIDEDYTALHTNTLTVNAMTVWTGHEIQILDSSENVWKSAQRSLCAKTHAFCSGFVYDPEKNEAVEHKGDTYSVTLYSPNYYSVTQRKDDAVEAYHELTISMDSTGDIDFFFVDDSAEIIFNEDGTPLFTHYAPF